MTSNLQRKIVDGKTVQWYVSYVWLVFGVLVIVFHAIYNCFRDIIIWEFMIKFTFYILKCDLCVVNYVESWCLTCTERYCNAIEGIVACRFPQCNLSIFENCDRNCAYIFNWLCSLTLIFYASKSLRANFNLMEYYRTKQ